MSVTRFLRTPAVILQTREQVDDHGRPVTDDMGEPLPDVEVETPTRCRIVHARSIENRDGGVVAVQELKAFLPPDVHPIPSTARLRARGTTFALDGPSSVVDSPRTGRVAYVVAPLRVVT